MTLYELNLYLDNLWKNHMEAVISKLSWACYAVRLMVRISNTDTVKPFYHAYFHSFIKYGKIFLEVTLPIMVVAQPRTSCRSLLKKL